MHKRTLAIKCMHECASPVFPTLNTCPSSGGAVVVVVAVVFLFFPRYGDMDITGEGCIEFFSNRRKITTRWPNPNPEASAAAAAAAPAAEKDTANFNGQM